MTKAAPLFDQNSTERLRAVLLCSAGCAASATCSNSSNEVPSTSFSSMVTHHETCALSLE